MPHPFRWLPAGLCLVCWLWIGCGGGQAAREVAALRQAGQPGEARERALRALQEKPGQWSVWRELAFCDELLSRDEELERAEQLRYLKEAALICAIQAARHDGQAPDARWEALMTMVQASLSVKIAAVMDKVTVHYRWDAPARGPHWDERNDPLAMPRGRGGEVSSGDQERRDGWEEADPSEAHAAVMHFAHLKPLSLRLPPTLEQKKKPEWRDGPGELEAWATRRNLDVPQLLRRYTEGDAEIAAALAHAAEDLADLGFVRVATVLHDPVLAP